MGESKIISYCLLWIALSIPSNPLAYNVSNCLTSKASSYVGIVEKGGNNQGFSNLEFEKDIKEVGWGKGQAWCSYFVMLLFKKCSIPNDITGWSPSTYNKKDVIFTDKEFKTTYSSGDLLVLSLSYDKFKKNPARYKGIGHTGVVIDIRENAIVSIEGNTNDAGTRDSRTGDGVYKKIRPLTKNINITRWGKQNIQQPC